MSIEAKLYLPDVPADILQISVREAAKRALNESFALGLTVTVFENGQLLRITPDGRREVIEDPYRDLLNSSK